MTVRARLSSLLAALAGAARLRRARRARSTIGIADKKPDMFSDARFRRSGVRYARLAVGWDALDEPVAGRAARRLVDARRAPPASTPLVSFGHSRTDRRSCPRRAASGSSSAASARATRGCASSRPGTRPTTAASPPATGPSSSPPTSARCASSARSCRLLAAEVLDMPNMVDWVRTLPPRRRRSSRATGGCTTTSTPTAAHERHAAAAHARPRARSGSPRPAASCGARTGARSRFEESPRHAAVATRFLFERLVPLSRRDQARLHLPLEQGRTSGTWDSALIGPGGRERPAYHVVKRELSLRPAGVAPARR